MTAVEQVVKEWPLAPTDTKDYTANYTQHLNRLNDKIDTSYWIVPSETVDDADNDAVILAHDVTADYEDPADEVKFSLGGTSKTLTTASVFLTGDGPVGTLFQVKNVITTLGGRSLSMVFLILIEEKRPVS